LRADLKPDSGGLAEEELFKAKGFAPPVSKNAPMLEELREVRHHLEEWLRSRYLVADAPSVYEQFGTLSTGGIEPHQFLFLWQKLSPSAKQDQHNYLLRLFEQRPEELKGFLKLTFRVDFIDDYAALKELIDYGKLIDLINANEDILDGEKISQFRERYEAEMQAGAPEKGG
jgi:hypothetical protein